MSVHAPLSRSRFFARAFVRTALALALSACTPPAPSATLVGYARLPAATRAAGPPSGARLGSSLLNGQRLPIPSQPVQGFSALVSADNAGSYFALADNGYGAIENSADFHLRIYRIRPQLRTKDGGSGSIQIESFIELADPDQHVRFALRNAFTRERILTGADFDPESLARAPDGTFWLGDEFGPFLLHCDGNGKLLEAPIPVQPPGQAELRSPQSPLSEESSALRILNALDGHAVSVAPDGRGRRPVFSPLYALLADGDDTTFVPSRAAPPPGSGLSPAASEILHLASIRKAGYAVVTWTVNDASRMRALMQQGIDGIISDRPDLLWQAVRRFDANHDGTPDFLLPDGLIDRTRFSAQGHRGGRDLRPENTLPAMEVALDYLMTTLETDAGISQDGVVMLSHDPHVQAQKCRRSNGMPYQEHDEVLIKDRTAAQLQREFICDKLFRGPQQQNDPGLSPASSAFARTIGLPHLYAIPTGQQLFDFVAAYARYYREGAGQPHPDAQKRARNAELVRFNLETKLNPRREFSARTIAPEPFAGTVARLIEENGMSDRADIQSFDLRTLIYVQRHHPAIRTSCLFGDFPRFAQGTINGSDDGTNLQGEDGNNTPWLAGLYWPYRITAQSAPQRVRPSGGIEAMTLSSDGTRLILFLEKPLHGESGFVRGFEFDLATKRFLSTEYRYPLARGSTSVGELHALSESAFLVIERDDTEGRLDGRKHIYIAERGPPGHPLRKRLLVDLLRIENPHHVADPSQPGDVGVGARYAFPYFTIESVLPLGPRHIAVLNDNNFPFSVGRHRGSGSPDDSELIVIELPRSLPR
ncbi:MAG: esterase-like activity of phytase family protein [Myxococcales bacterium]|nr:esterase-like activity of phytase family protein [Myxococcales bacterium]